MVELLFPSDQAQGVFLADISIFWEKLDMLDL